MKFKVQVVTLRDDGEESLREVACVERDDLSAVSLGLSLADSKAIVQGMQEVVVAWQMNVYLDTQRHCPQCGQLRHRKGLHHAVFRTVFGDVPVESPRLIHCPCQAHETESFSPLAELLPERTTPELLYLETKWASLVGSKNGSASMLPLLSSPCWHIFSLPVLGTVSPRPEPSGGSG